MNCERRPNYPTLPITSNAVQRCIEPEEHIQNKAVPTNRAHYSDIYSERAAANPRYNDTGYNDVLLFNDFFTTLQPSLHSDRFRPPPYNKCVIK